MIQFTKTRYVEKFYYYNNDNVIGRSLAFYGEYAQPEVDFLLQFINHNSVVYDIGGNIGYHASAFASTGARVFSFEPNPYNFKLLQDNTEKFDNVWLFNCAVGKENGQVFCDEIDPTKPGNFGGVKINTKQGIPVEQVGLDTLTEATETEFDFPPPDLIKIDVEGSEYSVLQGCKNIITKHRPVIYYEAHETLEFKEIYEFLEPRGYRLYWTQCKNYNPSNLYNNIVNVFSDTACFNVVAWPTDRPEIHGLSAVAGPDDDWRRFCNDRG